MDEEKNEEPIVFEAIDEEFVAPIKEKKPRSEKQKEALKLMIENRKERAIVERTNRKEKRAPKWYRELDP